MSERVAAIDCGTNSIRLLVADLDGADLVDVHREMRIVRLGQDVDRTGRLATEALERTRLALVDYAEVIRTLGASRVRMVATSATRDAANRDEFESLVSATLGVPPDVVSGREEAALSFAGAAAGLPGTVPPVLVMDVGGGSSEVVLGDADGPTASYSMDVGAVRLTERHVRSDPPTPQALEAIAADVRAALDEAAVVVPLTGAATVVGVAGTVTTIAAMALRLPAYDSAAVHGARVSRAELARVVDRLAALTAAGRAAIPVLHPGRADVIVAGAVIVRTIVETCGAGELVVSEHDILDGIARSLG